MRPTGLWSNAMRTVTAAEMREIDRRAIEDVGIPGAVLMNNAGASVFEEIESGPVGVLCGKGNNGGDGFVVARMALLAGFDTRVVLAADPDSLTDDASAFKRVYENLGGLVTVVREEAAAIHAVEGLAGCSVIVDALLGTGVQGEVRGAVRAAIEALSSLTAVPVLAVDIPSGLDSDTGAILGRCVTAATTVTFQYAKRGFESADAKRYLGRLVVADIGIPAVCGDEEAWRRLQGE